MHRSSSLSFFIEPSESHCLHYQGRISPELWSRSADDALTIRWSYWPCPWCVRGSGSFLDSLLCCVHLLSVVTLPVACVIVSCHFASVDSFVAECRNVTQSDQPDVWTHWLPRLGSFVASRFFSCPSRNELTGDATFCQLISMTIRCGRRSFPHHSATGSLRCWDAKRRLRGLSTRD
jgi:hypothetical protein